MLPGCRASDRTPAQAEQDRVCDVLAGLIDADRLGEAFADFVNYTSTGAPLGLDALRAIAARWFDE